jgi:hypothetical protein
VDIVRGNTAAISSASSNICFPTSEFADVDVLDDIDLVDDHIVVGLLTGFRFRDVPSSDPYPESVDVSSKSVLCN